MTQSARPGSRGVLTVRERKSVIDGIVEARLETVVPEAMRRAGIDMWLVICNEGNEDPVFRALVPDDPWAVKRLAMLVFFDSGGVGGCERVLIAHHPMTGYTKDWNEQDETQWEALARIVRERRPDRIGINQADNVPLADGLTAALKERLVKALDAESVSRLESAEAVAVEVLGRRLPYELEVYDEVVLLTQSIIRDAFSTGVITPGITSTEDVRWWMQQRVVDLGLERVSNGSMSLIRADRDAPINGDYGTSRDQVIRRGDAIYCDFGIKYLGLYTDVQEWGYVPEIGQDSVPEGLVSAMKLANTMQDILIAEFRPGRTGNEIQIAALAAGQKLGLQPRIYTHPIGLHVHGAGTYIGVPDRQDPQRQLEIESRRGDYPLTNSAYAIELSIDVSVPEWDSQVIRFPVEQQVYISDEGHRFLGTRQEEIYLVL